MCPAFTVMYVHLCAISDISLSFLCRPCSDASYFEALLQEARQLPTQLPAVSHLKGALAKADRWVQEAKRVQVNSMALC